MFKNKLFGASFPHATTNNVILCGIIGSASLLFILLLLLVFSSNSNDLYFDYDNNFENQNQIFSPIYHQIQRLAKQQQKIRIPFAMGRFYCDDELNHTNRNHDAEERAHKRRKSQHNEENDEEESAHILQSHEENFADAVFDNSGVSFGFVFSDTPASNRKMKTSSIFVDFSWPLDVKNTIYDFENNNETRKKHQPHLFNVYVLGFNDVADLPTQPELPFSVVNSPSHSDSTSYSSSSSSLKTIFRKEMKITTEDFTSTSGLNSFKIFDYKKEALPSSVSIPVFLVWIVKVTEPNYNLREFNTENVVKLHRFRLQRTMMTTTKHSSSVRVVSSSQNKKKRMIREERIFICQERTHDEDANEIDHQQQHLLQIIQANQNQRRIEFFGDSITAGMCNTKKGTSRKDPITGRSIYLDEDFTRSWAFLIGKKLGARIHTTAWSGIGLVRNTREQGGTNDHFKDVYRRTCASSPKSEKYWKFSDGLYFLPQVVVINLGTNDFSNFSSFASSNNVKNNNDVDREISVVSEQQSYETMVEETFIQEYFKMLSFLASNYGKSLLMSSSNEKTKLHIVLACGPMNVVMCDKVLQKQILDVYNGNKNDNEKAKLYSKYSEVIRKYADLSLLKFDDSKLRSDEMIECGTHPNDVGSFKMAKIGTAHLRKVMKWL